MGKQNSLKNQFMFELKELKDLTFSRFRKELKLNIFSVLQFNQALLQKFFKNALNYIFLKQLHH